MNKYTNVEIVQYENVWCFIISMYREYTYTDFSWLALTSLM